MMSLRDEKEIEETTAVIVRLHEEMGPLEWWHWGIVVEELEDLLETCFTSARGIVCVTSITYHPMIAEVRSNS